LRHSIVTLLVTAALVGGTRAASEPLSLAEVARVDAAATAALAKTGAPSVSIAVVRDGRIAFARAYGQQRLSPAAAATPDTRYDIGSVAKQFTAAAVLMLQEDRRLSLDDHVGRFVANVSGAGKVTLRQLLSHTAGYRSYWTVDYLPAAMHRPVDPQQIVDRWGRMPLGFAPGSQWRYSNTDYTIAGLIVERLSGEPLAAFLRQRIFRPLQMTSARPASEERGDQNYATGYTQYALGPLRPAPVIPSGWEFAAGGLSMTPSDLARWDISIIDRSILRGRSYDAQQTDVTLSDGTSSGYGLGVYVDSVAGHRRLRHDGGSEGFLTENRVYPDDRAAIVVATNTDGVGFPLSGIADEIEGMLLSHSAAAPTVRSSRPPPLKPMPGPDPTPLARSLVAQLSAGRLDRSRLTSNANGYFSPTVLSDYRRSLSALGEPVAVTLRQRDVIDGLDASLFAVTWAHTKLIAILRTQPDGLVEEFTMFPPG
jgi:CubicO group peptidase (beta-lactamase class C family)